MFAGNADQLREMIAQNPDVSPSTFLRDDSLAAYCFDKKTPRQMKSAFNRDADPEECESWGLSPSEWKDNIEMALVALTTVMTPETTEKEKM